MVNMSIVPKVLPLLPSDQASLVAKSNPGSSRQLTVFHALFFLCSCTCAWAVAATFGAPPFGANSGPNGAECKGTPTEGVLCLCPRKTVCATEWHELIFLVFSRLSAYFDYPLYVLLFLSKCHNLRGLLHRTYLREWIPLDDLHHLHVAAGGIVSFEVLWHSFWHILRWAVGGDIHFLWTHVTGRSGLLSLLITPLIAWPMMFRKARRGISFNVRKAMHYLSVVWGISICFHAPVMRIAYIMGIAVGIYMVDWVVGYFTAIHFCPTLKMTRLGITAVEIVFEHPQGFVNRGGNYVYLCLPWLGKAEWHAFSLYQHPTLPNHSSVCIARLGDWTKSLHDTLAKPSSRPGWIYGPFPSPFSGAIGKDNLIAVASGIGITPTIGIIAQLSASRKVNVIWMSRDADLIEYYTANVGFDDDAWTIIFYTGKRALFLDEATFKRNPRLLLIKGRPALRKDMIEVMKSVEQSIPLPEKLMKRASEMFEQTCRCDAAARFHALIVRTMGAYTISEIYQMGIIATAAAQEMVQDPLHREDGVSLEGFTVLVRELEGNVSSTSLNLEAIEQVFRRIDTSGNMLLDEDEFKSALAILSNGETPVEEGTKKKDIVLDGMGSTDGKIPSRGSLQSQLSVKMDTAEDSDPHFETWGVLYCGGATPVVKVLEGMQHDLGVEVKIESFDW